MAPSSARLPGALLICGAATLFGAHTAARRSPELAGPPRQPLGSEELQVTSVDVWFGSESKGFSAWVRGGAARAVSAPDELELVVGGQAMEVVSIATAAEVPDPLRFTVFFDAELSDQVAFRWAAARLAERAQALTTLGEVEVVVADPDPRVVVPPTHDADRLADALGGLALFSGGEAAIPLLRDEFLALARDQLEDGEAALAAAFADEETALVVDRQDRVLHWVVESTASTRGGRVLLYVSQGFDRRPEDFYMTQASAGGALETATGEWARTLAAYGWTCLPLVYQDRRAVLRRGFRIGKWRFALPGVGELVGGGVALPIVSASYEGERDARKAEALLELADGHLDRGAAGAAVDAYLRAIHHFYGDPRTIDRQAYAWQQLARALRDSGELDRSRRALANAIALDPSIGRDGGDEELALLAGEAEGLDELAQETGGRVLRDAESLAAALDALTRRQRLTFELAGPPTGDLLPIALTRRSGDLLAAVRWVRFGAAERVAAARLRLFLQQAAGEPDAASGPSLRLDADGRGGGVLATVSLPDLPLDRAMRVVVGVVPEESPQRVSPLARDEGMEGEPPLWRGRIELPDHVVVPDEVVAAAVYVEDVTSGEWTIRATNVGTD